jgi:hypothetical protein
MIKNISRLLPFAIVALLVTWYGCKKDANNVTVPPEQAHFMNQSTGSYIISAPGVTYKIPIGLTTPSSSARTVTVSVTSPTGAIQGTHYTLNKTTFTIPAGQVIDTLVVTGNYSLYTTARKDSLYFTIQGTDKGSSVAASDYNSVFKLYMRGPCSELEINDPGALNSFLGDYKNTNETLGTSPYGPYKTTVTSVTKTSATTANITVANIYDDSWTPTVYTLDWTNPANRIVTLVAQAAGGNAGNTFGAGYNGQPYAIRPASSGAVGTFSFCNQTIQIKANIGIWGVGYSGSLYTVNMAR